MKHFAQGLAGPNCPIILPNGDMLVVEMQREISAVVRIEAATGERNLITKTGGFPNGLFRDAQGRLWVGEAAEHALISYDEKAQEVARVTHFGAEQILWPNDLVIGRDGAIYMTDSGAPVEELLDPVTMQILPHWSTYAFDGRVYRIDAATLEITRIDHGIQFANGIAFDSEERLYISETIGGNIYRYDVFGENPQRELWGNVWDGDAPDEFIGPDGMKFGADGRLYVALLGAGEIAVFDTTGVVVERIKTEGSQPTSLAFTEDGQNKMFVTELSNGTIEVHDAPCDGLPIHRNKAPIDE